MGKSESVRREVALLAKEPQLPDGSVVYYDLSGYGEEARLLSNIFDSNPFRQWRSSTGAMHLFLDQFDTCLRSIPTLPALLKEVLAGLGPAQSRMHLRIVCRTSLWPEALTTLLESTCGEAGFGVYELAPLGRAEVGRNAERRGLSGADFVQTVVKRELQPLAGHPLTLSTLLDEYLTDRGFSKGRSRLFLDCALRLCSNLENPFVIPPFPARQSASRRLALASRIASALVFSNRSAINVGLSSSEPSDTDITLSSLEEGRDSVDSHEFSFCEADILDVFHCTALFSGRGPHRFGFASRSMQEFLAARYISMHQLDVRQIAAVTQVSAAPDEMTVPQLRQTVGWLASLMPKFVEHRLKTDPKSILVGADDLESRLRRELVDALLSQFDQGLIADLDWGDYSQYGKLKHAGLVSQLSPFIADKTKSPVARRVAIDIAEACELQDPNLHNLLASVALDDSEDPGTRDQAAHAVSRIGGPGARVSLRPLLGLSEDQDPNEQLKGSALFALWRGFLSAEDLFANLTRPRRSSFFGTYGYFLSELHKSLTKEDLSIALRWIAETRSLARHDIGVYWDLADNILALAWRHLDDPTIVAQYARAVLPRLRNYESFKPRRVRRDGAQDLPTLSAPTKHGLVKAIVALLESYRPFFLAPAISGDSLTSGDDLDWMIGEAVAETDENRKAIWVGLVHDVFRPDRLDHVEAILEWSPRDRTIASRFSDWTQPVLLASSQADAARASLRHMRELEAEQARWRQENERDLVPSVRERIEQCLRLVEEGDSGGWWRLCMEITLRPTSKEYGDEFEPDISALPGWETVEDMLLTRMVVAGEQFVRQVDPEPEAWLSRTDVFHRPAAAGVKALVLLYLRDRARFLALESSIWRKWAPAILDYPANNNNKIMDEVYPILIENGYRASPSNFALSLIMVMDKEDKQHGHLFCLRRIKPCMDAELQARLVDRAKGRFTTWQSLRELLSALVERSHPEARSFAESLLTPQNVAASARDSHAAALSLLAEARDAGWSSVWPAVLGNEEWGKALFLELPGVVRWARARGLAERIGWSGTADLFLWLSEHFPREADDIPEGAHSVGPRESIAQLRDGLLDSLRDAGTAESLQSLEHISKTLPELGFLPLYLIKARENVRRQSWSPLLPSELFALTRNASARLVLNADHLLDAVMESLSRLEDRLQGMTPMAFVLWDRDPGTGRMRPKSEAELSDFIKDHLTIDLHGQALVALREVEIRRTQSNEGGQGERVDIYIEGLVRHTEERIKAVIEVKGCWHREVRSAPRNQLVERYMNETGCSHAIYVVGWFCGPQWDKRDSRKNRTGAKTIAQAREAFDGIARSLQPAKVRACVLNCALR